MSNKSLQKTEIIYSRLKDEYFDKPVTWADIGKELSISRQALSERRKKESIDYDELKKAFPKINKDWLHSESVSDLKLMPVKTNFPNDNQSRVKEGPTTYSIDELLREERRRLDTVDIPDTELGRNLEDILDDAVSLVLKLRRLIEIQKKNDDS